MLPVRVVPASRCTMRAAPLTRRRLPLLPLTPMTSSSSSAASLSRLLSTTPPTASSAASVVALSPDSADAASAASSAPSAVASAGEAAIDALGTMDSSGIISSVMHGITWLHDATGLPWWGTVAVASLALRGVVAPFFYSSISNGARMMQHQGALKMFQEKQREAQAEKRTDLMVAVNKERREYMKKHDIRVSRMFMPILVQAPLFITFVITLRRFSEEAHLIPGFEDGGTAWFPHLHQADPKFVFPLVTAGFTMAAVQINNSIRSNQWFTRDQMRRGMTGLSLMFLPIAAFLPAVMTEYFAITSVTVFLQQASLHLSATRAALGLPPEWPNIGQVPARVGTHPLARFLGPPGDVEPGAVVGADASADAAAKARAAVEKFVEPQRRAVEDVDATTAASAAATPRRLPSGAKLKKSKRGRKAATRRQR